ncbi:MAG: hypothetical protein SOZ58_04250 [Prevotella sp.]|nr:hypothetical protein [Prevotella sp.]
MAIYDKQIISILAKNGDHGMTVKTLSMHIFNLNNSLFYTPDFNEIHRYVQQYLTRNSKGSQSLFCRMEQWGRYMINPNSAEARQLVMEFVNEDDE